MNSYTFDELRELGCPDELLMQYLGWTKNEVDKLMEKSMNDEIRKQIEAAWENYKETNPPKGQAQFYYKDNAEYWRAGAEFGLGLASEETKRVVSQWQSASIEWGKERGALAARVKELEKEVELQASVDYWAEKYRDLEKWVKKQNLK